MGATEQTWKEYFSGWNNMCAPAGGGTVASAASTTESTTAEMKPAAALPVAAAPPPPAAKPDVPAPATEPTPAATDQTWKEYFGGWNNMCAPGGGVASEPSK